MQIEVKLIKSRTKRGRECKLIKMFSDYSAYLFYYTAHAYNKRYASKIETNAIEGATSKSSMQASSVLTSEVWLTAAKIMYFFRPQVCTECACANSRITLSLCG
jgi:hypothetical protein